MPMYPESIIKLLSLTMLRETDYSEIFKWVSEKTKTNAKSVPDSNEK